MWEFWDFDLIVIYENDLNLEFSYDESDLNWQAQDQVPVHPTPNPLIPKSQISVGKGVFGPWAVTKILHF